MAGMLRFESKDAGVAPRVVVHKEETMASESSFDVVSEFDRQEMVNAVDQARREVQTRYDLKDSDTVIDLSDKEIVITTESEMHLTAVRDILQSKAMRRNLSLKIFKLNPPNKYRVGASNKSSPCNKVFRMRLPRKSKRLSRISFRKPRVAFKVKQCGLPVKVVMSCKQLSQCSNNVPMISRCHSNSRIIAK